MDALHIDNFFDIDLLTLLEKFVGDSAYDLW